MTSHSTSKTPLSDDNEVVGILVASVNPLSALEIGRKCRRGKSGINKALYRLLKRGQVDRDDKTPPLWSPTASSPLRDYQQEEKKMLDVIRGSSKHGASTYSIALALQKSVQIANPMLYALLEDDKVNQSPPAWKIKESERNVQATGKHPRVGDSSEDDNSGKAKRACLESTKTTSVIHVSPNRHPKLDADDDCWVEKCENIVWKKYKKLYPTGKDRDIIAGFLLKEKGSGAKPVLVALGSGTSIASGDNYSRDGIVVHDSHAEIVARRCLLRWLYSQFEQASLGRESMAVKYDDDDDDDDDSKIQKFALKPFDLWLYISQAPCGDGAVYSKTDLQHSNTTGAKIKHTNAGQFRTKTEAGRGTHLKAFETSYKLSFDGLMRGDRAVCQSCSDKIAKWNVIGVQGALLSRLMSPLYLSGIIIGDLCHHGNLARALCCRNEKALALESVHLPALYSLCHPKIRKAPKDIPPRNERIKFLGHSINWAAEGTTNNAEVVDSKTGLEKTRMVPSRICKRELFEVFCKLVPNANQVSYASNKRMAEDYQESKQIWLSAMHRQSGGHWMCKPPEVDNFSR